MLKDVINRKNLLVGSYIEFNMISIKSKEQIVIILMLIKIDFFNLCSYTYFRFNYVTKINCSIINAYQRKSKYNKELHLVML
jgi:intein-encoded DNA endonuclease-like protein